MELLGRCDAQLARLQESDEPSLIAPPTSRARIIRLAALRHYRSTQTCHGHIQNRVPLGAWSAARMSLRISSATQNFQSTIYSNAGRATWHQNMETGASAPVHHAVSRRPRSVHRRDDEL